MPTSTGKSSAEEKPYDATKFPVEIRHKLDKISVTILKAVFAAEDMQVHRELFDAKLAERNYEWNSAMTQVCALIKSCRAETCESLAEEAEREAEQLRKHGESIPVTKHYEYAQISNKAAVWSDRAAWLRSKGVER